MIDLAKVEDHHDTRRCLALVAFLQHINQLRLLVGREASDVTLPAKVPQIEYLQGHSAAS